MHKGFSIIAAFFSVASITSARYIPCAAVQESEWFIPAPNVPGKVFIGYNGFSNDPRPPQASAGGQLGAVFYITDSVDLAKLFALGGPDRNKDTVCFIYADQAAWNSIPKAWVPKATFDAGGAAVDKYSPGAVVFAEHTAAGVPAGHPAHLYQLGIRQGQIARLQLTTDCRRRNTFPDADHETLNYPGLTAAWNIHGNPAPLSVPFWSEEEWRAMFVNLLVAPMLED